MERPNDTSPLEISVAGDGAADARSRLPASLREFGSTYEYDADTDTHHVTYDGADGAVRPSTAVVEVLAALDGADPTDLEPLFGEVDPDALDRLARRPVGDTGRRRLRVSFTVDAYEVTVRDN